MAEATPTENATWMENLPQNLHDRPLIEIAIPGSHDSFAYKLDKTSSLAPDVQGSGIAKAANILKGPAKAVIYKWSLTQTLNFTEQLNAGIRYFDLRLSTRPDTPDSEGLDDLYLVHGLYGPKIEDALTEIKKFLKKYPKEVLLLDFQHFYRMEERDHNKCATYIIQTFENLLCPTGPYNALTLNSMWNSNYQVILFYRKKDALTISEEVKLKLWDSHSIDSPWHNAPNINKLLQCLEKHYQERTNEKKKRIEGKKKPDYKENTEKFHVTQGILTPDAKLIVSNAASSLKKHCGIAAASKFVGWVKSKEGNNSGINICIMDYVEMENFIDTVISLNY